MVWISPLLPDMVCLWPVLVHLPPPRRSYCFGSRGTALVSLSRLHVAWGWAVCTCLLSHGFPGSCCLGKLPYDHIGAKGPWSSSRSALSSQHHGQHSSRHFLGTRHVLIKWMNWQDKKNGEWLPEVTYARKYVNPLINSTQSANRKILRGQFKMIW